MKGRSKEYPQGGNVGTLSEFLILLFLSLAFGFETLLVIKILEHYDPF